MLKRSPQYAFAVPIGDPYYQQERGWCSLAVVIWRIDRETALGLSSRLSDALSIGVCDGPHLSDRRFQMPQYLYQLSYTAESLAAQIQNPQDRIETAGGDRAPWRIGCSRS